MPVRFVVTVAPDLSPAVWRDKVRALDDSPVDVLLVNDHLTGLRYAPMVALGNDTDAKPMFPVMERVRAQLR